MDDDRKQELIERYRDINVDHDWWGGVYSHFIYEMMEQGIYLQDKDIHFSGFGSQGDGASFEGDTAGADMKHYMDTHYPGQYPMVRKLLDAGGYLGIYSRSISARYCHENTVDIFVNVDDMTSVLDDGGSELREAAIEVMQAKLDAEIEQLTTDERDRWRGLMQDLYARLKAACEYLTSDEAVWEAIEANELDEEDADVE